MQESGQSTLVHASVASKWMIFVSKLFFLGPKKILQKRTVYIMDAKYSVL